MASTHPSASVPMRVLVSSTFAFTICFAVWMIFAVLGIPIKTQLGLSETEFGLLAAMPVLTGSWCACRWASGPTATAAGRCSSC